MGNALLLFPNTVESTVKGKSKSGWNTSIFNADGALVEGNCVGDAVGLGSSISTTSTTLLKPCANTTLVKVVMNSASDGVRTSVNSVSQ